MFAKLNHVSRLLLAVAGGLSLLAVAPAYAEEELEEVAPGYDRSSIGTASLTPTTMSCANIATSWGNMRAQR